MEGLPINNHRGFFSDRAPYRNEKLPYLLENLFAHPASPSVKCVTFRHLTMHKPCHSYFLSPSYKA
jgi:hypothetical protein